MPLTTRESASEETLVAGKAAAEAMIMVGKDERIKYLEDKIVGNIGMWNVWCIVYKSTNLYL